uniref:Transmembrane and tetratricopeptide repeat containing 2 n=2 Tax=Nothobranchius furzeri TaxID=105023 RepID=A0A1A7ZHT1_NOTFU
MLSSERCYRARNLQTTGSAFPILHAVSPTYFPTDPWEPVNTLGSRPHLKPRVIKMSNDRLFLFSVFRQANLNEAAEKYYGQAASLRPDYPAALMNLGAILHLNGKLQKAEANYLRALQLKPDDTITQSNLRKLWNIMEKQGLRTLSL